MKRLTYLIEVTSKGHKKIGCRREVSGYSFKIKTIS